MERLDSWDDDEAEDWHPAAVVQRTVNIRRLSMARIHNAMTAAEFVSAMTALVDGDVAVEQEPLSPLWSQWPQPPAPESGYGYTRDARRKTKKVGDPNLRPLKRTQRRVAMY